VRYGLERVRESWSIDVLTAPSLHRAGIRQSVRPSLADLPSEVAMSAA
jgi:hypothetical protein